LGVEAPQKLRSFRQNTKHRPFKAKSRFILLQLPTNLSADIFQPFLLSELPNEFDVQEAFRINISEEYLEVLWITGKNETVVDVVRLIGCRGNTLSNESLLVLPPPDALA
jgi:hypothetical protein